MRFLSCFSGIEAASCAWRPLGWECVGVAEVDPFACAVLAHRHPAAMNLGDVAHASFLSRAAFLAPDVLVGGPPCQDFSVAGLRLGLEGARGNLTLRWVQIIHAANARFSLTENVPGWLSANKGHAFGAFLGGLVGAAAALVPPAVCGGRWTDAGLVAGPRGRAAWRILDAQHFGLAQRRRRVFVVFCPAGGADPAAVLLERAGLRRDLEAGGGARQDAPARAVASVALRGREGGGVAELGGNLAHALHVATAVNAHGGPHGRCDFESETFIASSVAPPVTSNPYGDHESREGLLVAHTLRGDGFDASEDGTGRGTPLVPVAFQTSQSGTRVADTHATLDANNGSRRHNGVLAPASAIRRLTPVECERLQGFEDDYTAIPWRGGLASDGPRYKSLGNSFAVPVVAWLGARIAAADTNNAPGLVLYPHASLSCYQQHYPLGLDANAPA